MNDYDQGARYAVKHGPRETMQWLFPKMKASLKWHHWMDSQSAPRPGEPDRRCDTIAELRDDEGSPPWAMIVELFTEADADAIDRALEYLGRFRRELRHGPYGHDRYPFAVALIFLTGAPREKRLDMNLPGMEEIGLWFGPRLMHLAEEDGVAHLDAFEHNGLSRWPLVWTPLMRGGQTSDVAKRWRALLASDPRLPMMAVLARTFARLTECEPVWTEALEGIMDKTVPFWDEVRKEERIKVRRQATLEVLETRFPGQVPAAIVKRLEAEEDLDNLQRWHKLAITSTLETFQQQMG